MTSEELSRCNGKNGQPAYVAYKGIVYDVSDSDMWEEGEHQGDHSAGMDLTEAMENAPHTEDVFNAFKVVGKLTDKAVKAPFSKPDPQPHGTASSKEKWRQWYRVYHPHPMAVHFPIVLHFFAGAMDIAFLFSPLEKFEQGTYYAFFAATLFGLIAMVPGILSWWVNYDFKMIRPLVIKLYTSIFTLLIGSIAVALHLLDPMIAYKSSAAALFYHFSVLITVPAVVVLGYYGGRLTWWRYSHTQENNRKL